jgi:exopolysaccharide production protein ExoQ
MSARTGRKDPKTTQQDNFLQAYLPQQCRSRGSRILAGLERDAVCFQGLWDVGIIGPMLDSPASGRQPKAGGALRLWQPDKAGTTFAAVLLWVSIIIMVVPQGLDYQGINGMPTSSDALGRFTWLFLLGGSALALLQRSRRVKVYARWINPFFLGFFALATLSIVWSIDPGLTIRRVLRGSTVVMVVVGFTLVGWHAKRFQNVMRPMVTAVLVSSIIFVMVDPDDSMHHVAQAELMDAWHGVTMGKNILGSFASVSVVLWLHAWLSKEARPMLAIVGIATSVFVLVMTRSSTSVVSTAFAVMFMLILLRSPGTLRRYMPYIVGIFATLTLIYALAVLRLVPGMEIFLKPITTLTGKDLTFTGRTAIWDILNQHIHQRPLLGSGYGAYWAGPTPTSPSFEMLTRLYFYPTEGHNGYLDIINDLGWVGAACLLAYFAVYVRQSLTMMRFDRYQGGLYLTLLFRGFMADMSESHWFVSLSVDFVIMALATAALGRGLLQNHLNRIAERLAQATAAPPAASVPPLAPPQHLPGRPRRGPSLLRRPP